MKHAAALVLCLGSLGATAQPVYRCGNDYSRVPCPQGRVVEATDGRTAAQRAEARAVVADEARRAADMKRDRLAEQAAIQPAAASSLSGSAPHPIAPAAVHPKKKHSAAAKRSVDKDFVALDPASRKKRPPP